MTTERNILDVKDVDKAVVQAMAAIPLEQKQMALGILIGLGLDTSHKPAQQPTPPARTSA